MQPLPCAHASRWGIPDFLQGWEDPRKHSESPDTLTREERRTLLESLRGDRYEVAAYLAGGMGLRPKEWRLATSADVRRHSQKLRVHRTKIYRDQELPIPPFVLEVIERRSGRHGPLVGDIAGQDHANAVRAIRLRCERAGVPAVSWYGLRHTYATLLAERHPIHVVQAMLGHASITTTQRYLHAQEHHLRAAADEAL